MATYAINNRTRTENNALTALKGLKNALFAGLGQNRSATAAKIKYDEKYCKETEASVAGVFLLLVPIMFTAFSILNYVQYEGRETFITIMSTGALVFRVIATRWISSIATEQNRNASKWMALSFFLPAISLIIIGQTKKIAGPVAAKKAGVTYTGRFSFQNLTQQHQESLQMAS